MAVWLSSCERINGMREGNAYIAGPEYKFCFHTTEGESSSPAAVRSSAGQHANPPHLWCSFEHRVALQLVDLERSAYALKHDPPASPQTNRAKVIQVEIEGFAASSHQWPREKLDWLTDVIVAPACQVMGINASVFRECHGEGEGIVLASTASPIRINDEQEWYEFNGLFGHQHAPGVSGNAHWDPGRLDLGYISARIAGHH